MLLVTKELPKSVSDTKILKIENISDLPDCSVSARLAMIHTSLHLGTSIHGRVGGETRTRYPRRDVGQQLLQRDVLHLKCQKLETETFSTGHF